MNVLHCEPKIAVGGFANGRQTAKLLSSHYGLVKDDTLQGWVTDTSLKTCIVKGKGPKSASVNSPSPSHTLEGWFSRGEEPLTTVLYFKSNRHYKKTET